MTKQCFKCKQELPLTHFYKHPEMADGRLNKCCECTRKDVSQNYRKRKAQYQAYERQRFQTSERKAHVRVYQANRRRLHPEKYKAHTMVGNAIRDGRLVRQPCEGCGTTERVQAHHDDYFKPLDVRWLCFKCHRAHHGQEVIEAA